MSSDHVVKSPDTAELKVAAEEHLLASSVRLIPNEVYSLIGSYIHITLAQQLYTMMVQTRLTAPISVKQFNQRLSHFSADNNAV